MYIDDAAGLTAAVRQVQEAQESKREGLEMDVRVIVGMVGMILAVVGTVIPAYHMPVVGGVSLAGGTDGYVVYAGVAVGLIGLLKRRYGWVYVTAALTGATVAVGIWNYHRVLEKIRAEFADDKTLAGPIMQFLLGSCKVDIGMIMLAIGAGACLLAAYDGAWMGRQDGRSC